MHVLGDGLGLSYPCSHGNRSKAWPLRWLLAVPWVRGTQMGNYKPICSVLRWRGAREGYGVRGRAGPGRLPGRGGTLTGTMTDSGCLSGGHRQGRERALLTGTRRVARLGVRLWGRGSGGPQAGWAMRVSLPPVVTNFLRFLSSDLLNKADSLLRGHASAQHPAWRREVSRPGGRRVWGLLPQKAAGSWMP